eukprot:6129493-Prymnesium_polylepis.1
MERRRSPNFWGRVQNTRLGPTGPRDGRRRRRHPTPRTRTNSDLPVKRSPGTVEHSFKCEMVLLPVV